MNENFAVLHYSSSSYFLSFPLSSAPHKKINKTLFTVRVSAKIASPNIILQAEVDYDSEIGSGAWNIPPVIFQLQLISRAISGSRSRGLGSLGSGPCATDVLIAVS